MTRRWRSRACPGSVRRVRTGTTLLAIGALSHETTARLRGSLLAAGERGRWWLGALLVVVGLAIVSGADKRFEAWAVEHSPAWLTELTTRF